MSCVEAHLVRLGIPAIAGRTLRAGRHELTLRDSQIADTLALIEPDDSTCWLWKGHTESQGYGTKGFSYRRDNGERGCLTLKAHRLVYTLARGPIPDGLVLDHWCEVKNCVNPAHLLPVTQYENTMRSLISLPAVNARKATCANGHPYDRDRTDNRGRYCSVCHNDYERRRRQERQCRGECKACGRRCARVGKPTNRRVAAA